jgi:hypothetical protein
MERFTIGRPDCRSGCLLVRVKAGVRLDRSERPSLTLN